MRWRRRGPRPEPKGPQTWVVNGLYHVTTPAHVKARGVNHRHAGIEQLREDHTPCIVIEPYVIAMAESDATGVPAPATSPARMRLSPTA